MIHGSDVNFRFVCFLLTLSILVTKILITFEWNSYDIDIILCIAINQGKAVLNVLLILFDPIFDKEPNLKYFFIKTAIICI